MPRILIAFFALVASSAIASPSPDETPVMTYSLISEGHVTRVYIFKSRIEYLAGEPAKNFTIELAPIAADDLFALWKPAKGEKRYAVDSWPQEFACGSIQRWHVSAGGETRTICRNSPLVKRLSAFHDSVLSLF